MSGPFCCVNYIENFNSSKTFVHEQQTIVLYFSFMTRQEHLQFCKVCKNQRFDRQHGIICGLTDKIADFEESCESFIEEESPLASIKTDPVNNIASQGKRFANYILDFIFMLIFNLVFGMALGIFLAVTVPDALSIFDEESKLFDYTLGFVAGTLYYSVFEYYTGRSIAKFITKTRVVDENGERPNFKTILIRSICRFIPFEPFSFLSSGNRGWHDTLSKTYVIEE